MPNFKKRVLYNVNKNEPIEDLQARVAFQEDLIQSLNDRVVTQEKELLMLQKQLQHVYAKLKGLERNMSDGAGEQDVPPPHY